MLAPMFSDNRHNEGVEQVALGAQATTVTAAAAATAAWHFSLPEWAAIVSMTVAVLGFFVQAALAIRIFMRDAEERRSDRAALAAERKAAAADREAARVERLEAGRAREASEIDRARIIRAVDDDGDAGAG